MKSIIHIILLIFTCQIANAQCWQTKNTQTTDWRNFPPNGNQLSTNKWDWTLVGLVHEWYATNTQVNPSFIELPYFCSNPPGSGSCGNLNTYCYEVLGNLPQEQDIWPEDGWELVIKSFGVQGKGQDKPSFVLYNKYTGKLKVYIGLTNYNPATSAALQIGFTNGGLKRALFNHVNFAANTLLEFKPANYFQVPNNISQEDLYWLVAEVQTSYDPCNCLNTSGQASNQSSIQITAQSITTTDIDANINGTIDQNLQSVANGTSQTTEKFALDKATNSALKSYQEYSKFATQMNGYIDKLDNEKKIQLAEKWLQEKQKKDANFGSSLTCTDLVTCYTTDLTSSSQASIENFLGIDKDAADILKKGASVIPYVGAAIGLIDYLSNLGNEKTATSPKAAPMSFQTNLKLKGQLTSVNNLDNISFYNPGSVTNSTAQQLIPFYNNTLGVFNMLKSPKFQYYDIKPKWQFYINVGDKNYQIGDDIQNMDDDHLCQWMKEWKNKAKTIEARQYQLKDLVKFVVNPSSDLDVENIEACIVFDYKKEDFGIKDPTNNPNQISNALFIKDATMLPQTPMIPYYKDITNDGITLAERIKSIEATGMEFENVNEQFPIGQKSFIRFRTKYLPLSCLGNMNFTLVGHKAPNVYIKMRIVFKTPPNKKINPVQIITYDVSKMFSEAEINKEKEGKIYMGVQWKTKDNFWNGHTGDFEIYPSSTSTPYIFFKQCWGSMANMDAMNFDFLAGLKTAIPNPFNDYTSTLTYNPTANASVAWIGDIIIPANTIVPNNSKIESLGTITIQSGVTIGDGCIIRAEKLIDVVSPLPTEQPTIISPTSILEISSMALVNAWGYCDPNIEVCRATKTEIEDVCKSKQYVNAINSNKRPKAIDDLLIDKSHSLQIFPNPTSSIFNIQLSEADIANTSSVNLYDITGHIISQNKGYIKTISTEALANGTYIVEVILKDNTKMKQRLVVTH